MEQFSKRGPKLFSTRQSVVCLAIAVCAFLVGVSVKMADAAWTDPTQSPPAGGTAPINVGSTAQQKTGSLKVATESASALMVGGSLPDTKLGVDATGKKYGIDIKGASEFAGYFRGDLRVVDSDLSVLDDHFDTVGIYSNARSSGLYIQQDNIDSDAGLTVSSSGGVAIQAYGGKRGISATGWEYGVYGEASQSDYNKTYGVYGLAGNALNPGDESIGVYGKTGQNGDGNGKVYGLYVENNANGGDRWAGFFKDSVSTNQPTVEINSQSGQYGLRVYYGGQQNSGGDTGIIGEAPSALPNGGNTYGVVGKPGGASVDTQDFSYGVYGYTEDQGQTGVVGEEKLGGGTGVMAIANNGTSLVAVNNTKGYAIRAQGLVDAGDDGVFANGFGFFNNSFFTARNPNTSLVVGSLYPIEKLTVNGAGFVQDFLSADYLKLRNQKILPDQNTRYRLDLEQDTLGEGDDPGTPPKLCIETTTAGSCTDVLKTCVSRGSTSIRSDTKETCESDCQVLFISKQYTCRWSCNGKLGNDDCLSEGSQTRGEDLCSDFDGYFFEPDAQAPASNCTCMFSNPNLDLELKKQYKQAKFDLGETYRWCQEFPATPTLVPKEN